MVALTNYTVLKAHDLAALAIISGHDYALVLRHQLLEAKPALRAVVLLLIRRSIQDALLRLFHLWYIALRMCQCVSIFL